MFKRVRKNPEKSKEFLLRETAKNLGPNFNETDFVPPYNPWDQRLCLVPDADFFTADTAEGEADSTNWSSARGT